jgi:osmotically-inducible protein OsmY
MNRYIRQTITQAGLALFLVSGPAHAAPQDAWITTKAKLTLLTTEGVSTTSINVDTIEGQVTLHGKVATETEKSKAASAVAGLDGVKNVRNLLQVVPSKEAKGVQVSDDEIERRVRKELAADQALADSKVEVKSVNDGVVLLGGTTTTLIDHLRAVEDAARVPGVRRVASEIQSPA